MTDNIDFIVIEGGGEASPPVTRRRVGGRYCHHGSYELDTEARRIYCGECGVEVDPVTVLVEWMHRHERWTHSLAVARSECQRKEAELAELKRQVRNARAQLRRTQR